MQAMAQQADSEDGPSVLDKSFMDFCSDMNSCASIQRTKLALQFYQTLHIKDGKDQTGIDETDASVLKYANETNRHIISDYHHILSDHLDCSSKAASNRNFAFIHKYIDIQCDIKQCPGYVRNNRDRQRETQQKLKHDEQASFYIDLLDTMHCYFVHSEDVGFRMKATRHSMKANILLDDEEQAVGDEKSTESENDNEDEIDLTSQTYVDESIRSLRSALSSKRRALTQIRGAERVQHNKFLTNLESTNESKEDWQSDMPEEDKSEEKHHSDPAETEPATSTANTTQTEQPESATSTEQQANTVEVEQPQQEEEEDDEIDIDADDMEEPVITGQYQFGYRYYYWPYYKSNKEEDWLYNPGYRYCDWFVPPKYVDLKWEVLKAGLSITNYQETLTKATNMLQRSYKLKEMQSDYGWKQDYGLSENLPVQQHHVMAVLFYTDYTKLSYEFSRTFRKLSKTESDKALKKRNSNFHHWSKYLREMVEVYGTKLYQSNTKLFYHGVSKIYFTSFVANFYGPTSTTTQIEVASIFSSDKGIILALEQVQNQRHLKFFNCSYLSAFGNEDERLFIGGQYKLQFQSIFIVDTSENCQLFAKSLLLFDCLINGYHLHEKEKKRVSKVGYKIIEKLIKMELQDVDRNAAVNDHDRKLGGNVNVNVNAKKNMNADATATAVQVAMGKKDECNFPAFVVGCFRKFVRNKKSVTINVEHLKRDYGKRFCKLLLHEEVDNLLKFDFIALIFINCTKIECEQTGEVTAAFLTELVKMVQRINELKWIQIETIYLRNVDDAALSNESLALFENEKWRMKQENEFTLRLSRIKIQRSYTRLLLDGIANFLSYTH